jgi:MFS family permease
MQRGTLLVPWLWITACVSGALVMAVEFLGARMLGPQYGASQTVWAAMISVTLLSLTIGYFLSGRLADRFPRPAVLYGILFAAGVLLVACPHTRFILDGCYHLGIQAGALASSMVVFFLPLCLLGMTSPFVIKLITARGRPVGRTAGSVYAISTVGSVAGTLLAAFLLIPAWGTAVGFRTCAVAAGALAAVGLVSAVGLRAAPVVILPFALGLVPAPPSKLGLTYVHDGQKVVVRDVRESLYGRIVVLDKGDVRHGHRLLVVNGIVQTGMARRYLDLREGERVSDRVEKLELLRLPYFQELLPFLVDEPAGTQALLIGLAGGQTAALLERYGISVDAVDLDPEMIEVARRWFHFDGPARVADGRRFLEDRAHWDTRYDFCVIDTYSGDAFPFYMASVEGFRAARAVLRPGGVLAVNFIGSPGGRPFACVYRTLGEVFGHVRALNGEPGEDVQTITLFASHRPLRFEKHKFRWMNLLAGSEDFTGRDPISALIRSLEVTPEKGAGSVLTDAHNPVDFLRAQEAVRWRERTVENIGPGARL